MVIVSDIIMKRDAYGDDGPAQKRQRQLDDEVTFLIPSKVKQWFFLWSAYNVLLA